MMTYCFATRKPSTGSVKLRAICFIHASGSMNDAGEINSTTRNVDDKQYVIPNRTHQRDDFDGEEVMAAIAPQCARENELHDVRLLRSGAGSKPPRAECV